MATEDDWSLLEAWQGGDAAAGERLFDRHFASVSRFWRSKLPDQAQDMIQRTFLAAVEGRGRISKAASFRAYLFGAARNLLFRHLRDHHAGRELDFTSTSMRALGPGPSTEFRRRREHRRMIEALRSIPLDLQIVLELYFWEELPAREIASVLELPEGTVRSRVRRAREAFAEAWQQQGTDRLPATDANVQAWARQIRDVIDEED